VTDDLLLAGGPAASLVNYQPGAVVSRTLVKTSTGTVTAFAFDEGQELSEHTAPFDALVLMIDGEAEITISRVTHRASPGHLIRLPASEPHALKALTRFKMLLVMIKA
jgi:quercetin dioxygenase-like cupin family protein